MTNNVKLNWDSVDYCFSYGLQINVIQIIQDKTLKLIMTEWSFCSAILERNVLSKVIAQVIHHQLVMLVSQIPDVYHNGIY